MNPETLVSASLVLAEIGVGPLWVRRDAPAAQANASHAVTAETQEEVLSPAVAVTAQAVISAPAQTPVPAPVQASAPSSQPPARIAKAAPQDDGLPAWLTEMDDADTVSPGFIPYDDEDDDALPAARINPAIATMNWQKLKDAVAACQQCGLCQGRKNTVFGVGDQKAKWLFIGEGPGRNEDQQGEPFVGPAGKLLDNMLLTMGLKRGENAYISNIVKCRATDADGKDRIPSPQEIASCLPYLQRQIALIEPTVLVALGKTAALALLGLDPATPVSKLRGTVHRYQGLPLVVTYHPAYLLRQLGDKSKAWSDLCLAMTTYADISH